MTTYKIYRTDGSLLHEGEAESFKAFVEKNKSNLYKADLKWVNLEGANLEGANLVGADLERAYLRGSDLRGSDFRSANLESANLEDATLEGSTLYGATLYGATLYATNLRGVNFKDTNLQGANLEGANIDGANIDETFIPIYSKHRIGLKLPNSRIENQNVNKIILTIGCKTKTLSEWDEWFASDKEFETKRDTFEFRQIKGMYKAYREYIMTVWGE